MRTAAVLGSPPTVSGQSSLPTTALSVGNHIITAIYSGDVNYSSATSETPVSVQVVPTVTSTTLTVTTNAQGTTLYATVVVTSPGDPTVVGTVAFYNGTRIAGNRAGDGRGSDVRCRCAAAGAIFVHGRLFRRRHVVGQHRSRDRLDRWSASDKCAALWITTGSRRT